ncbi:unnamed protein product, partial [marine sediment metagenome]
GESVAQEKSKIEVVSKKPPGGWAANEGQNVLVQDNETGEIHTGSIRIKAVTCGKKGCTKCPHHIYAYAKFRTGKKVTEKYLGVAR